MGWYLILNDIILLFWNFRFINYHKNYQYFKTNEDDYFDFITLIIDGHFEIFYILCDGNELLKGKTFWLKHWYALCSASLQHIIASFERRSREPMKRGQIFWKKKCSVDESEWYLSNTLHARVDKNINGCKRFELKRSLRYYIIFKIWNSMEYK